ncbi:hypothetical protein A9G35_03990 [Gilliamella sp. Choc5-1]|jgi:hypothetical protein|uniref:DUF6896 domain-containing protein n=1 Tax=Gilliamella sp. Choc5-1 TaxID=3120238 RepID=UPI00080DDB62|nr:hypothetical protein [Gilliamella apicola]OCG47363.1 hypothetical protein A9G35_03990 [Gilliamella apicola]
MKKYIKEMLQLQNTIITVFKKVYPEVKDYNLLLDCPKKGKLDINGQQWLFVKHGKGLKFIRKDPLPEIIIDMHNYFSEPNVLDEWRLEQYIDSLNLTYSTSDIKNCLHELTLTHFLKRISEQQYKLNEV